MSHFSKLLLLAPVLMLAATAQAKPAKKSVHSKTTATAAARVAELATYQIAPAPGAPKLLVHLWGVPRKTPTNSGAIGARWKMDDLPFAMATSPFVYDIFSANGKGGWNYMTTFVHRADKIPDAPTVRYLNNKTKTGYVFQVDYSDGAREINSKIYAFPEINEYGAADYVEHNLYPTVPTGGWRTEIGFSRDARGYVQLISAEKGYSLKTHGNVEYRTVSNWDEAARIWKAGPSIRIEGK